MNTPYSCHVHGCSFRDGSSTDFWASWGREDDEDVVGVPSLEEQIYLYLDLCTPRARLSRPAVTEARANFLAASPERQWCVW